MAKRKKIHWMDTKSSKNLSQIFSSGLEYAFVSDDNYQCMPFAYCKDYLQDAIHSIVNNKKVSIYGFSMNPKQEHLPSLKKTKLLITNSMDNSMYKKIELSLDFINQIEYELKILKTKIRECLNPPKKYNKCGIWYYEGSKRWIKSSYLISLYTFLIRVSFSHKENQTWYETCDLIQNHNCSTYQSADKDRMKKILPLIQEMIKFGDQSLFFNKFKKNYPKKISANVMHNEMGILGLAKNNIHAKKYIPKWFSKVGETK